MSRNRVVVLRSTPSPEEFRRFRSSRVFLWGALIAGILFTARYFGSSTLRELLQWISGLGASAPLVFMPLYVVACVLFVPGSILTLSAGFLFGVVRGSVYVSIAATLGATLAFLIGRYFARQWVAARLANYPKFNAVDEAVAREGWKIVALTRLSPVFPFNLLNYSFGLTRSGSAITCWPHGPGRFRVRSFTFTWARSPET
jgi:uncharacterized membrane protein YdjX (TVP38/TMEM64 family)